MRDPTDGQASPPREFRFTREEFDYLRKVVNDHTGIVLSEHKFDMVYARLVRRIRELGLSGFDAYVERVRSDHGDELAQLINAITTGLTAFFREPHHYQTLRDQVVPSARARRRLRIWSAGCSSGEEPYSIAITVLEEIADTEREPEGWDIRVLATDLDTHALARARLGVYPIERLEPVSSVRRRRWFLRGRGTRSGEARVKPVLQQHVTFNRLNLLEDWPSLGAIDAIFCRNVMIYFDQPTKTRLLHRFRQTLGPGGWLFLGHSESLIGISDVFDLVGRTTYRVPQ